MLRDVKTEVFYPYPPERVWQVLTNPRALAAWLMDNDFEPRVGHRFRFQAEPQQGLDGTIYCEVIQLDEPRCLSYTWRGSFMCKPTIVTWTLLPVEGGTQLQLEHKGFENEAIAFDNTLRQPMRLSQAGLNNMPKAILDTQIPELVHRRTPFYGRSERLENFDSITLNFYLRGGWHSALNSSLKNILVTLTEQSRFPSLASHSSDR
jgi:uncharacterized protein YndB with AHSA1/START domain